MTQRRRLDAWAAQARHGFAIQEPRSRPRPAAVLALCAALTGCGSDPEGVDSVWPIGGTDELQPMSSSFGPRIQASRDGVYDFHRGIDIPTVMGTPVYAIADGTVLRAGRDPAFTDVAVQLEHCDEKRTCFYSSYIHLTMPLVEAGDEVSRGQHIGYTGLAADSRFPHLHFEVREGGPEQVNCVHPLRFLPTPGGLPPVLALRRTDEDTPSNVTAEVDVTLPAASPGLLEVAVSTSNRATGELIHERVFNYEEWNRKYTTEAGSGTTAPIDDQTHEYIRIEPAKFNVESSVYAIGFRFSNLDGTASTDELRITARARDVHGHVVEVSIP